MGRSTLERRRTAADAMVTRPKVHPSSATVGELRTLFADEHVHVALLVEEGELVGTIERSDLAAARADDAPASELASTEGRTIDAHAPLSEALTAMRLGGRRRLAVTNADGELLGLLCLKASGRGFCSDEDVAARGQGVTKCGPPLP
jgi:CBS domain-containing protein